MKHVTLMREDRRRKPAVTAYCAKCDWTYKTNDRVEARRAALAHDKAGNAARSMNATAGMKPASPLPY